MLYLERIPIGSQDEIFMAVQGDQQRIMQLVSPYSPTTPPQLPLTFGDYLSLLWLIDHCDGDSGREAYYRKAADSLSRALGFEKRSMCRLVQNTPAGGIYAVLENAPYRGTIWLVDAQDRRAAMRQLLSMRDHIVAMGVSRSRWQLGWPGSRLSDVELRERLFAVFFTAFDSQYSHFSRLLLVIDIVLQELLLGDRVSREVSLIRLIKEYGYPDPDDAMTLVLYDSQKWVGG
jgi:hypothetical protein